MITLSRKLIGLAFLTGLLTSCAVPVITEPAPGPIAKQPSKPKVTIFRYGGEYNLTDMTFAFVASDLRVDLDDCGSETARCLSSGFEVLLAPRCESLATFPAYAYDDMEIMPYGRTVVEGYFGKTVPVSVYAVRTVQDGKPIYSLSFFNSEYGVVATAITQTRSEDLTLDASGNFTDELPLFYSKTETGAFACR